MTKEDLIEKYVAAHADCRWMDAGDLNDLLHSFVEELDSLVTADKDLEKAALKYFDDEYADACQEVREYMVDFFRAGAQWQKEQFEKNRLAACESQTKEDYDRETAFVEQVIEKEQRQPTFSDAITYGMRLQKEQMLKDYSWLIPVSSNIEPKADIVHTTDSAPIDEGKAMLHVADKSYKIGRRDCKYEMMKDAVDGEVTKTLDGHLRVSSSYLDEQGDFKFGDKVRIIILPKEDEK